MPSLSGWRPSVFAVTIASTASPAGCEDQSSSCDEPDLQVDVQTPCPGDDAAHAVYNTMWSALDQHYALFDLRLPDDDWAEIGRRACPSLHSGLENDALFDVMMESLRVLDDGHVQLWAPSLERDEDAWVTGYAHEDLVDSLEGLVEERYLDAPLRHAAEDGIAWGRIGDVGYLSVTSMDDLSADEEESTDRAAAAGALQAAMRDLASSRALVVDIRANGGGWDVVSLEIATWFQGPRALAWSEQRRGGPGHTDFVDTESVFVDAARPEAYAGPVALLISGATFSAAETFVLAMRQREHVTVVGETTSGHFSDLLTACLPNGWALSLSGERYRAADGVIYEGRGLDPDLRVELDPAQLEQGRDVMLEAALDELGAG